MLGRQTGARMEALREAGARAPCNAHAYMIWDAVDYIALLTPLPSEVFSRPAAVLLWRRLGR